MAPNEYGFYANVNPMVDHPRWSQARERRLPELHRQPQDGDVQRLRRPGGRACTPAWTCARIFEAASPSSRSCVFAAALIPAAALAYGFYRALSTARPRRPHRQPGRLHHRSDRHLDDRVPRRSRSRSRRSGGSPAGTRSIKLRRMLGLFAFFYAHAAPAHVDRLRQLLRRRRHGRRTSSSGRSSPSAWRRSLILFVAGGHLEPLRDPQAGPALADAAPPGVRCRHRRRDSLLVAGQGRHHVPRRWAATLCGPARASRSGGWCRSGSVRMARRPLRPDELSLDFCLSPERSALSAFDPHRPDEQPSPGDEQPSAHSDRRGRPGTRGCSASLIMSGFRTIDAHNGIQALEKVRTVAADAVVTDLAVPGMDGFEFCRALHQSARHARYPDSRRHRPLRIPR